MELQQAPRDAAACLVECLGLIQSVHAVVGSEGDEATVSAQEKQIRTCIRRGCQNWAAAEAGNWDLCRGQGTDTVKAADVSEGRGARTQRLLLRSHVCDNNTTRGGRALVGCPDSPGESVVNVGLVEMVPSGCRTAGRAVHPQSRQRQRSFTCAGIVMRQRSTSWRSRNESRNDRSATSRPLRHEHA